MKKIIISLLALVVVAVLSVFVLIMNFDVNQYRPEIIELVKANTGRDFRIEGELSIEPSLIPTVVAEGVYFGNAAWGSEKDMVKVERFEAVAELLPLLENQLSIKKIVLIRPVITLEKNQDGQANWELSIAESEEAESEGEIPAFDIKQIRIIDATLNYLEVGAEAQTVRLEKLTLRRKSGKPNLDLELIAQANNLSAKLEGKIGLFEQWLDNQPYAVDLKGSLEELDVSIQTRIQQPQDLKGVHIELDAQSSTTMALTDLAGAELPELGPLSIRLVVDDTGTAWTPEHIGLKYELTGSLSDLRLDTQGSIGHLQQAAEVAVTFNLTAESSDLLARLMDQEMAEIGSFSLQGSLADLGEGIDKDNPGVKLDIKGGFADVSLTAAGMIGNLKQMRDVDLSVDLQADSTEQLIKLSGQELEPAGPLSFQAQLVEQGGTWKASAMSLKLGRSDVAGQLQVTLGGDVPSVEGQIKASQIDLTEFIAAPEPEQAEGTAPATDKVFPSDPLPRDQLKQANIKLDLQAAVFRTHEVSLENLHIGIDLKNGDLKLSPFQAGLLGGRFQGSAALSANRPDVDLKLKVNGLEPTQLPEFRNSKELEGARTDLDIQIRGRGASIAAIAASANGLLKVKVGEGKINNSGINLAGGDLLIGSISALNPLADKDPSTKLECAAINFVIKDGIASNEKGFALQTEKLNILGGGQIDLKTEEIDIHAKPKPREGIGLNLSGMAGVVRLGGTLANPAAKADAVGVAKTAAKVGAALATGGLSILAEGLFDRATVDDTICEVVLTQKKASQSSKKKTKTTEPAETKKEPTNPIEGAGAAIKGLFGQ